MPGVDDQKRQAAKQEAARTAVTDNNLAAGTAVAAGLVAFVSPPHAAALCVGSGLFWLLANYRQSVANDPARDDFDVVWKTSAQLDESLLPGTEPREQVLYRLGAQQLLVGDALYALLRSLERFDGATAAGSDLVDAQVDAIAHNAEATVTHQETLIALVPDVNQAWASIRAEFVVDPSSVTLEDVQQLYREIVGDSPETPAPPMVALGEAIVDAADDLLVPFDTGLAHPVLDATELPPQPSELVDAEYVAGLEALSEPLRELVVE